ncbi:putative toxin-antitoxin system antitoxin component (TIGR02293 family) [Catalinimonas alkaloidigena]|uniref:type II RES/Xre toxin-antitoxin system antitoxin n=1 Tax=Catalinimonas alkaloidigena TaxID=1075417 RepID=UPI002406D9C0|nr:antitoxin Xre/MbcA/ParS toxin-binding domain-containing protein [Catalinimonas alkaloidigena]MDF9796987.1 putative toxin-antitoxin system antitoxin component (TIGR02293 family) [Catalinimonas alkaloidigena]
MYAHEISSIVELDELAKIESPYDLVRLARRGVTRNTLKTVSQILGVPLKELIPKLPIGERTLQRYTEQQYLPSHVSEQIIQWAQVALFGRSVFATPSVFQHWMQTSNRALGNVKPADLLDTRQGAELLLQLLGQIEHGVYR